MEAAGDPGLARQSVVSPHPVVGWNDLDTDPRAHNDGPGGLSFRRCERAGHGLGGRVCRGLRHVHGAATYPLAVLKRSQVTGGRSGPQVP